MPPAISSTFAKCQSHLQPLGLSENTGKKAPKSAAHKRNLLMGLTFFFVTHFQLILSMFPFQLWIYIKFIDIYICRYWFLTPTNSVLRPMTSRNGPWGDLTKGSWAKKLCAVFLHFMLISNFWTYALKIFCHNPPYHPPSNFCFSCSKRLIF